jgi:hypothetical protein
MPVSELQRIPRAKPIRAPGLNAGAFPPDPAPDDVVPVNVKIVIEAIVTTIRREAVNTKHADVAQQWRGLDMPGTVRRLPARPFD